MAIAKSLNCIAASSGVPSRMQVIAVVVALALTVAGCSEPASNEVNVDSNFSAVSKSKRPGGETSNGTRITNSESLPAEAAKDATTTHTSEKGMVTCFRVGEAEAQAFPDLEQMGSSGSTRIFGRPRELLCSEPGVGGRGECELVGRTVVRLESGNSTYGFRSTGAAPAILTYSPTGFSCAARSG